MPAELLKVWTNWEAGIGHTVDDGRTPGMYHASGILGGFGELRPAPVKKDVDGTTSLLATASPQSYFEENKSPGLSYLYVNTAVWGTDTMFTTKFDLRNDTYGNHLSASETTADDGIGQCARYQGSWYLSAVSPDDKTYKLAIISTGTDSGTANAAVTTTTGPPGTLTDTRATWTTDEWDGATITCNGKTMEVASNTATVLTGTAGWSGGGNPGAGKAWALTSGVDTWTAGAATTGGNNLILHNFQLVQSLLGSGVRVLKKDGDPLVAADWGPFFQVGDKKEQIGALAGLEWGLVSVTPRGAYSFNVHGRSGPVLDNFHGWINPQHYVQLPTWGGGVIYSHPTDLLFYRPGQAPIPIGLGRVPGSNRTPISGAPALHSGRYKGAYVAGNNIFTLYQPDVSSTAALLLAGDLSQGIENLSWQGVAPVTLSSLDPRFTYSIFVSVTGYPMSATVATPSLWSGDATVADKHFSTILLAPNGSPFHPRVGTHKVVTSGDVYLSETTFNTPQDLSHIIVHTQDMTDGDEWKLSAIINDDGTDRAIGSTIINNDRVTRPIDRTKVYRVMFHLEWIATSTSARVAPSISRIELWGTPSKRVA